MSFAVLREGRASGPKKGKSISSEPSLRPKHVVALAASAGGLAALTEILASLPADFAAPVLVLQHLSPRYRSWLSEILGRRVALPVVQVQGGEHLEAGRIYVAPPDHHLVVDSSGCLDLSDVARVQHVRPSADVLFASLSEAWGDGAIAVVLTGTGRDGAEGVRAIKERGGTVIAQDEASADFFGMPNAAFRTGMVDRVLPLDEIAPVLIELTLS
jgi:two-component system, chemotaxis family, protein-glutamate methylesterase/glutaminase